mgnify:CR=1 FL=1
MKRVLSLVLCILMTLAVILPPCAAVASSTGYVTAESLNLRQKADAESKILKVLHDNDKVEILGSTGNWYQVEVGGTKGYVSKNYIWKANNTKAEKSSKNRIPASCTLQIKQSALFKKSRRSAAILMFATRA